MEEQATGFRGSFVPKQPSMDDYELASNLTAGEQQQNNSNVTSDSDELHPQDDEDQSTSQKPSPKSSNTASSNPPTTTNKVGRPRRQNAGVSVLHDDENWVSPGRPRSQDKAHQQQQLQYEEEDEDEDFATQPQRKKKSNQTNQQQMQPSNQMQQQQQQQFLQSDPQQPIVKKYAAGRKGKICTSCGTTDTPMWRRGPEGKGTLCNACGVKWSLKFRKRQQQAGVATGSPSQPTTSASIPPFVPKKPKKEKLQQQQQPAQDNVISTSANHNTTTTTTAVNTVNSHHHASAFVPPRQQQQQQQQNHSNVVPMQTLHSFSLSGFTNSGHLEAPPPPSPPRSSLKRNRFMATATADDDEDLNSMISNNNDETEAKDPKRPRHSSLPGASGGNGNDLLERLIHVVEDQLVGRDELEQLGQEVDAWGKESLSQVDIRAQQLEEAKRSIASELMSFRSDIANMVTLRQSQLASQLHEVTAQKIAVLGRQTQFLRESIQSLRGRLPPSTSSTNLAALSEPNNNTPSSGPGGFRATTPSTLLKAMEDSVLDIQQTVQQSAETMARQLGYDTDDIKHVLLHQVEAKEAKIVDVITNIKLDTEQKYETVKRRVESLNQVLSSGLDNNNNNNSNGDNNKKL